MACNHKMMDVVLLHCPPENINFPPLQTALLATQLEYAGFSVLMLDLNVVLKQQVKEKYQSSWLSINEHYWHDQPRLMQFCMDNNDVIEEFLQSIIKMQAKVLFIDLSFPKELFACEILKKIRKGLPEVKIIVGGLSSYSSEQREAVQKLSDNTIDYFVSGIANNSLPSFLAQLASSGKLSFTKKQLESLAQSDPGPVSRKSNIFPSYRECNLNDYRGNCLSISMGFGCTGTCTFCKKSIYSDFHYHRSAENIIEEIQDHVTNLKVKNFYLSGAPINSDITIIEAICDTLISSNLKISWSAEATAYPILPGTTLAKMKQAGCHTLIFCTISGCDAILSAMNAGFTVQHIEEVLERTHRAGIRSAVHLIAGVPGEYKKELLETQKFIAKNRTPLISAMKAFSVLKIYPGTKLFTDRDQKNIQLPDVLSIDRWKRFDGNNFYIRKIHQNQLHYHILRFNLPYNPHDLIVQNSLFSLNPRNNYREKKYQLDNFYNPWHTYHSDILSKAVINYVWGKTTVVEKNEMDYPVIQGIENGKQAFIGPETVHLDITNHCNFNCIACWDRSPLIREKGVNDEHLKKSLSYERITELIDDLVTLGGVRFIKFSGGGEPTMHPRFHDILTYLRSKDRYIEIDINTNFSLINDKLLNLILDLQVNLLTVSLWAATPEVYVQTHPNQKESVFEKIIVNLKKIKEISKNSVLRVFLHNVIMSQNHQEIDGMLQLAMDVNADEVHFTLVDLVPGKTESLLLSHDEHLVVLESLKRIKPFVDRHNQYHDPKTNRSIQVTNFHEFFVKMSQTEIEEGVYDLKAVNKIPCYIGWLYTRIMADGRIVPCCKGHRLPMGDLNKDNFITIWNAPRYRKFRYNGKTLEKSAPYFSVMGDDGAGRTGCLNCDNIIHNTVMHDKYLCYSNLHKWFFFKMNQWLEKLF